jgi:hypothetical protein
MILGILLHVRTGTMTASDRSHWKYSLLSESATLLELLAISSHAYLVPVDYHHRQLISARPNCPLVDRGVFSPRAVQELIDWCLIELKGTSDGTVPSFWSGDVEIPNARGCAIDITRNGIRAALELKESQDDE